MGNMKMGKEMWGGRRSLKMKGSSTPFIFQMCPSGAGFRACAPWLRARDGEYENGERDVGGRRSLLRRGYHWGNRNLHATKGNFKHPPRGGAKDINGTKRDPAA